MANYDNLKAAISAVIKENGNNEITGNILQGILVSMVNSIGVYGTMAGEAVPATSPGTIDGNVFFFTKTPGNYVNFGGLSISDGEIAIISNTPSGWEKMSLGIYVGRDKIGLPEWVAGLDEDGKVPVEQIPELPYAEKENVNPVVWGVGDENKNLFFYFDKDLLAHLKLHPDSYPPLPGIKSDIFDWAIADRFNNIIFGVLRNGEIYPNFSPTYEPTEYVPLIRAESKFMPTDVSRDGIWNQWIEPIAEYDVDGNLWFCTIGTDSNIYVNKKSPNGAVQRKKLGRILSNMGDFKSDDHNCPAILMDNRPGAEYPIMIFQVDHNTTPMRYWRFETLEMNDWDINSYETIGLQNLAYSQAHRNNDEIFVFARRPNLPRPWYVIYSPDNGETWTMRVIFTAAAEWLYLLTKQSNDGAGLHIMGYGHPQNSSDQNIYYMYLDYSTGDVVSPGDGVVIPDIRAAIGNTGFVPIDFFDSGKMVYEATGLEITRFWDYQESGDNITLLLTGQTIPTFNKVGYETSRYKAVNFSFVDGVINYVTELSKSGYGIEGSSYWAGGALVSPTKAVLCVWTPDGILNGGSDIVGNTGLTEVSVVDFSDTEAQVSERLFDSSYKVIRPYVEKSRKTILFIECEYFNSYDDFYSSILVNEVENFNL